MNHEKTFTDFTGLVQCYEIIYFKDQKQMEEKMLCTGLHAQTRHLALINLLLEEINFKLKHVSI